MDSLPNEMVVHILNYAFPDIGVHLRETREALAMRETSPRCKQLVDEHLFAPVKALNTSRVARSLSAAQLLLFTGIRELSLFHAPYINDDCLSRMIWLEKLSFLTPTTAITEVSLYALTRLKTLSLCRPTHQQRLGLLTLTQLEALSLLDNHRVMDQDLALLSRLCTLHLHYDTVISGSGFGTALQELSITWDASNLQEIHLSRVALQLRSLQLVDYVGLFSHEVITQMSNLRTLMVKRNTVLSDETLKHFTGLTNLALIHVPLVTDHGLSTLSLLETVGIAGSRDVTPRGLVHLKDSLRSLFLADMPSITLVDLLPFKVLERVVYTAVQSIESDEYAHNILSTRGVTVQHG